MNALTESPGVDETANKALMETREVILRQSRVVTWLTRITDANDRVLPVLSSFLAVVIR